MPINQSLIYSGIEFEVKQALILTEQSKVNPVQLLVFLIHMVLRTEKVIKLFVQSGDNY